MLDQDTEKRVRVLETGQAVLNRSLCDHLKVCEDDKKTNRNEHLQMIKALQSVSNRLWVLVIAALGGLVVFLLNNLDKLT